VGKDKPEAVVGMMEGRLGGGGRFGVGVGEGERESS
jgi:hypothetical protein